MSRKSSQEHNIQQLIDDEARTVQPKNAGAEKFGWDSYFHLETIYKWMDELIEKNDFVTGFELGLTYELFPIRGLKISRKSGNPAVFVESGIHAREWIAPATATYLIDQFVHSTGAHFVEF